MDYLIPIIIFLTLLLLFHILFIKLFPQNKRFWKKVDYLWISFGLIGIIGATFSYRKETASAWTPWHKHSLKLSYNQYQENIRQHSIDFKDSIGYFVSLSENEIQRRKFNLAGNFFNNLSMQVDSCKNYVLNEEQYYLVDSITNQYKTFIDSLNDKIIIDVCRSTTFFSNRIKEEAITLNMLRQKEDRDTLNWLLLIISPYIFAFAIAIRLTKVTAELNET